MTAPDRLLLWAAAWGVDLLFLVIAAVASNLFLFAGALIYGLLLAAFALAASPSNDRET